MPKLSKKFKSGMAALRKAGFVAGCFKTETKVHQKLDENPDSVGYIYYTPEDRNVAFAHGSCHGEIFLEWGPRDTSEPEEVWRSVGRSIVPILAAHGVDVSWEGMGCDCIIVRNIVEPPTED